MNNYTFLIDKDNKTETVYFAVRADKIETLKVSDTYGNYGQAVTPEDAGDWISLDSQKAVDVANKAINDSIYYVFINDNDPEMNVIADDEDSIKSFIENGWETSWDNVKNITDVTQFYEGNGNIEDFDGENFTDLRSCTYKIADNVLAYDNSNVFDAVIEECEENEDYTIEGESCQGFNYYDGSNFKSIILSYENNDYYCNYEIVEDEELVKELNEAIENCVYECDGHGSTTYGTPEYSVVQTAFASDWSSYQVSAK